MKSGQMNNEVEYGHTSGLQIEWISVSYSITELWLLRRIKPEQKLPLQNLEFDNNFQSYLNFPSFAMRFSLTKFIEPLNFKNSRSCIPNSRIY